MKRANFVKITEGEHKGKTGTVKGRTEEGDLIIAVDLDGDPLTPAVEIKVPQRWAKALGIINWFINTLLPLLYGIKRK